MSRLRSRWIFWKPWNMLWAFADSLRISKIIKHRPIDLWLTYHSYYKAPDLIGPTICSKFHIPYIIFQGSYSTRVKKKWQTKRGFELNTRALLAADLVIVNRQDDLVNLRRLLPENKLDYLVPGIIPRQFTQDLKARQKMREHWGVGNIPVVVSAAMFRADVKTKGLCIVIESCARLLEQGHDLRLVIAGDGRERKRLVDHATNLLTDKVIFTGRIERNKMYEVYSGGDIFAFPGINESLGMVFLEAQSCGLPVVAFHNGGIPEVVCHGKTGYLTPLHDMEKFDEAIATLLRDQTNRSQMGKLAAEYIRLHHDLDKNYAQLDDLLQQTVKGYTRNTKH